LTTWLEVVSRKLLWPTSVRLGTTGAPTFIRPYLSTVSRLGKPAIIFGRRQHNTLMHATLLLSAQLLLLLLGCAFAKQQGGELANRVLYDSLEVKSLTSSLNLLVVHRVTTISWLNCDFFALTRSISCSIRPPSTHASFSKCCVIVEPPFANQRPVEFKARRLFGCSYRLYDKARRATGLLLRHLRVHVEA
jgi:hypothetical protein